MSSVVLAIYGTDGAPMTGAIPSFARYVDYQGSARTSPSIGELGSGLYSFEPSDSDVLVGTAYLVTTGGDPAHYTGSVGKLVAWAHYASDGSPMSSSSPNLLSYSDLDGTEKSQPTVVNLGGGLYGFTPTADDLRNGRAYLVDGGSSAYPRYVSGMVEDEDTVAASTGSTTTWPEVVSKLYTVIERLTPTTGSQTFLRLADDDTLDQLPDSQTDRRVYIEALSAQRDPQLTIGTGIMTMDVSFQVAVTHDTGGDKDVKAVEGRQMADVELLARELQRESSRVNGGHNRLQFVRATFDRGTELRIWTAVLEFETSYHMAFTY